MMTYTAGGWEEKSAREDRALTSSEGADACRLSVVLTKLANGLLVNTLV